MPVNVRSEIGSLKKVLLQRPGRELEHLSPDTMGMLLFDDIPYLHRAQKEHDRFAELLREEGVEVVYLDQLMEETLGAHPELRDRFIREALDQAGHTAKGYREDALKYLLAIEDTRELIHQIMAGVPMESIFPTPGKHLADMVRSSTSFVIPPMPNLYFTRDPFAIIGNGVSINRMHTETRARETLFGKYIFNYHPDYAASVPQYYQRDAYFSMEGGDILNLSEHVLAVGVSERTQPEAIEKLAKHIFEDREAKIDTVLAFAIPRTRAFMHLDTVFTQVDVDKFTVHPGILSNLHVYELTGRGEKELTVREVSGRLEDILARYLELDHVTLICCGGDDRIAAEREQWNDGSNTLCIRPGTVIVYDRNYVTNQLLEDSGIQVISFDGSELSRGRGGPRCMSMPLVREEI
ncbi:MAG: arginine deiminase [Lachnospiraceae bacterium]|nr:arginine deiminase [Lachnospiraceae bacterium]